MIKIADVTKNLLKNDEIAFEAMRLGVLNFSAYADKILSQVEEISFKPVKKTTIVTALSRMAEEISDDQPLYQHIKLDDIVIKSPLCDVTFEKSQRVIEKVQHFREKMIKDNDFLTVTQGTSEVTIIIPEKLLPDLLAHFDTEPKAILRNLVGVGARFSDEYIPVPNVIYSIIRTLATRRINILEIVSTYTEISVIVAQDDMKKTLEALEGFFREEN